jgi:hypothetical protein
VVGQPGSFEKHMPHPSGVSANRIFAQKFDPSIAAQPTAELGIFCNERQSFGDRVAIARRHEKARRSVVDN